jgi:hypothetical protein
MATLLCQPVTLGLRDSPAAVEDRIKLLHLRAAAFAGLGMINQALRACDEIATLESERAIGPRARGEASPRQQRPMTVVHGSAGRTH